MNNGLMIKIAVIVGLLMMFVGHATASSVETYQFSKPGYEVRFHELAKILRCPKCQNQNLADSNSMISQDLRRELYRLMEEGRSDEKIIEFMVMRYGDFVLYKPKFDDVTYFLWLGPFGFGAVGLIALIVVVVRQRNKRDQNNDDTSGEETLALSEQEQIARILKENK